MPKFLSLIQQHMLIPERQQTIYTTRHNFDHIKYPQITPKSSDLEGNKKSPERTAKKLEPLFLTPVRYYFIVGFSSQPPYINSELILQLKSTELIRPIAAIASADGGTDKTIFIL